MQTTFKHAAATAVAVGALMIGSVLRAQESKARQENKTAENKTPLPEGKSEPSQQSRLAAQVPGVVKEILVKRGDEVKQGQPLIQQDDRAAVNQLQILERESTSTVRVDAAKWDLAQKEVERKRIETLYNDPNGRGATDLELERAVLDVKFKGAQKELSEMELDKAKLEAEGAKLKVEFMRILAPYDGIIETIETGIGEMLDPQRPGMLTIVKNDPLKIVVQLKAPQAAKLKKGDALDVRYKNDAPDAWQQAKVTYLAPVATAGAGYDSQREVHLEMPNPSKRETGLWLWIKLPEPAGATADAGK
ncbi:MAG: efflux RND transporter periplasmic adaptor subunit [Tepidisphaeraceae bacterium]